MYALEQKIKNKSATVSVLGLGYVGLPLAVELARAGFRTLGFDTDSEKVSKINNGISYIGDVRSEDLSDLVKAGTLCATTDFDELETVDTVSICVPTPLRKTKDPDISYVVAATNVIKRHLHPGMLVVLESTTYPGTTNELLLPEFESCGLKVGKDFHLAFSPERVDPGNKTHPMWSIPKVIGGVLPECTEVAALLYQQIVDRVVTVGSARAAEMVKLLENTFRAVNIGLVNEIAIICDKLGIDTTEVIEAAATKPFGFMKFTPGPGLGGHCIPIDPHYLSWKLKSLNYTARFIELASDINSHMPDFVVEKIAYALNDKKKYLNGSRILVLGVTYKKDVSDARESPALDIIELLKQRGAQVDFHDPCVSEIEVAGTPLRRIDAQTDRLAYGLGEYDSVVILTDHSCYDYASIAQRANLLVDTRNATNGIKCSGGKKIIKL